MPVSSWDIPQLGRPTVDSPLGYDRYVETERIIKDTRMDAVQRTPVESQVSFELAGPRGRIFFDPSNVKAAIVTCGGLCPGLNDVIRSLVHQLYYIYGVRKIRGVRHGYAGLNPANKLPFMELTPDRVLKIQEEGGTFLGSSRGPEPAEIIVDTLYREDIQMLFTIGGDGTLAGAKAIYEEITRRGLKISVVGLPKTIDNDIHLLSRTFGFNTAVEKALESLRCAHVEATAARDGIGIVKLMGRHSGFIAANAALALADVNFVLIPEVPFDLDGPGGFLAHLEARIKQRGHALVVVAEGAGQHLFSDDHGTDASGNRKLGDIGLLLKQRVKAYFEGRDISATIKYIDPSYIIRSVPANASDSIFCVFLGQHAVHAAMAGKSGLVIGRWNATFVHVPLCKIIGQHKQVAPDGLLWRSVMEATGQPHMMNIDTSTDT